MKDLVEFRDAMITVRGALQAYINSQTSNAERIKKAFELQDKIREMRKLDRKELKKNKQIERENRINKLDEKLKEWQKVR